MHRPEDSRRLFRLGATPRTAARDVDDEVRFHLDARVAELTAQGMPRTEAERMAAREFGDVSAARAELTAIDRGRLRREARGHWWASWLQDVQYAVRALRRQPGFVAAVLLTIALGVGANGAIFSVTDAALLRPLPYREPDRLVHVWRTDLSDAAKRGDVAYPNFLDWRARTKTLSGLAGYHTNRMVLSRGDQPRVLSVGKTTSNFFDVLGVRAALGRTFVDGEDVVGGPRVVVVSHELWTRELGADPTVVGRAIPLDGAPYTVVGVLPDGFQFALVGAAEAWVPFDRAANTRADRSSSWFFAIARLRPDATVQRANDELRAISRELATAYPDANTDRTTLVVPLRTELAGPVRPLLMVLFGAVGFVLLVALANVANLLLVRGTGRQRELAVRAALGAGQGRIVRQLLVESALLALGGGVLGIVVAHLGVRALVVAIPPQRLLAMPYLADVGVNARLLAYMLALSLVAGMLFGLVPALRVARPRLGEILRQGARGSSEGGAGWHLRDGLVAAELAMTVILLAGAALFGRSLERVLAVDPGFRAERVTTAFIPLPRVGYASSASRRAFFLSLDERLHALPGVTAAGLTSKLPLDAGNSTTFTVVGDPAPLPGQAPGAAYRSVTPDYFHALGIPLLRGRVFDPRPDTLAREEIVVSASFAREYFRGRDPIGRQIVTGNDAHPWTIVGLAGDVTIGRVGDPAMPTIYWPYALAPEVAMRVVIRTRGDEGTAAVERSLRRIVRELDPQVALYQAYSMESMVQQSESVFLRRYPLILLGAFAGAALLLAAVGTYGVISYAVAQRTRELGIRVALGASTASVVRLVVRHAAILAAAGVAVGIVAALGLARVASSLLYEVRPSDPATYLVAVLALGTVAALAAALPARRAARVDPAVTLRND